MANELPGRTLSKLALVLVILAPCLAVIPCIGLFADILVFPAIILSIIGIVMAASDKKPLGFPVGVLIAAVVALPVTIGVALLSTMVWGLLFAGAVSAAGSR